MAQSIPAFAAEDGTLHKTECAAVSRDLEMLLEKSPLFENKPYTKIAHEWLASNAHEIGVVLCHYARACPKPPEESSAPVGLEGTRERTRGIDQEDCD